MAPGIRGQSPQPRLMLARPAAAGTAGGTVRMINWGLVQPR